MDRGVVLGQELGTIPTRDTIQGQEEELQDSMDQEEVHHQEEEHQEEEHHLQEEALQDPMPAATHHRSRQEPGVGRAMACRYGCRNGGEGSCGGVGGILLFRPTVWAG